MAAVPAVHATPLNSAGAGISLSGTGIQGSFLDVCFFTLGRTFGLNDSVNCSKRIGVGMVSSFTANLFTATGSIPLLSGTDSAPGSNLTNKQFYAASLAAGAYRLEIGGFGSGFLGGGYTGSLTAVPTFAPLLAVPEPESWALLLIAPGTLALARRRAPARGLRLAASPVA